MSLHIFANIATHYGTAANNRGENEGNITTLQKLIWFGQVHSTVSAEAIRFALRRQLADAEERGTNRTWDEDSRSNEWKDHKFERWVGTDGETFIDDDLLGYMTADAATEEAAGSANVRRAVLEVTIAVSLTPWSGDVTFNAASPGATASAAKKGNKNPVPYGTEVHATRYQYGFALTPDRLREPDRAAKALNALASLQTVAGNQGRFLFDFSPEVIVIRITEDPAPRLLYSFDTTDGGKTLNADALLRRVDAGDIAPSELLLGTDDAASELARAFAEKGVPVAGVKATAQAACSSINSTLGIKE